MLEDNRDILETMTQALMKYETIDSSQIDQLMAREEVSPSLKAGVTDDSKKDES